MKASFRWSIVVLLMIVAMATWQGGRVVFAAPGATPDTTPVAMSDTTPDEAATDEATTDDSDNPPVAIDTAVVNPPQNQTLTVPEPTQEMPTAAAPAMVTRVIDISPLVTVSLQGGHSFDGYLLTKETMGKDPVQYIGLRPANFAGSTGFFAGVMVVRRSDVGRISFFDADSGERKDLSLPEFIRMYMTETLPAPLEG